MRFRLKFGYAELEAPLSSREASIVAKEKMDVLSKDVSGTGPFRFKEIVQGDRAVVVKNPDYWRKGLPYLDEVVFKEVPEAATRQTSIQKGDTDIFWQVPFDLVDQLGKAKGVKLSEVATNAWDPLVMHAKKKPFDDPRVRKAIRLACNKDQLIKVCIRGHGQKVVLPLLPTTRSTRVTSRTCRRTSPRRRSSWPRRVTRTGSRRRCTSGWAGRSASGSRRSSATC